MMNCRIAVIFILTLFNIYTVQAQPSNDFNAEWKKTEQFEKKGLTRDALKEVIKIFEAANKAGNMVQQIKAAMYQMKYRNMVEEDNRENNIFYLDTLIAKSKAPAKNMLQSMQAELFKSYRQQNRYKLYDRTELTTELSNDITTWSIAKLNATTAALYKASLNNESLLKVTTLNGLDAILIKGQNTRQLRPTLYDFLAHRALEYFMNDENDVTVPSYQFIINDEKIFAPAKTFAATKFFTKDSSSLYFNAILLLQNILQFHLNDVNKDALLDADLIRLAFANEHGVFNNKSKLYEEALMSIEANYPGNPYAAQAMYLRAQEYMKRGSAFHPVTAKENQYEIKKAKELCELAIYKFPKTEGALLCKNLLAQINQPSLSLETEKVNVPGEAFRSLLKYKNVSTLYLRVVKTSREELKAIEGEGYDKIWPALIKLPTLKSWSVALPDLKDYQQHNIEIKIDALPAGTYMILASLNPNFDLGNNIIARQVTYVSNISYLFNNKKELYVLNRNNGQPIAGAEVQLWEQKYDYNTRKQEWVKKEKYSTDKNGLVKISLPNNRYNNFVQVKLNNDELFTDDTYYSYSYDSYNRQTQKRSFLFTDRSIYRPGQTLFFKGIVVSTDTTGRKSALLKNYETKIELYDANYQKIGSRSVKTNDYGSFNGNFKLPEGSLNGQFFLKDSTNQSQQYFIVEEYKRPKFLTEIKKPEGTYRINDLVTVTGNAKAYAGNNIDGAKVSYRVVRRVQYPVWWGWGGYGKTWPPYGRGSAMEIINGVTTTDADGNYKIQFKAIPDETVNKKDQPTFYYEVSADVTDINGETRSGETTIAVAYQVLQLNISIADKFPADSLKNIKISSTNMNGLFEKVTVNFTMFKLQEPGRIFRKRYWETPDQFIINKNEYYANFPHDVYADEDQQNKWPIGEKVLDFNDTTSVNGQWSMVNRKQGAGWYKIIVTTKDKYGEEVKAEKIIYIINEKFPAKDEPVIVEVKNKTAEPGETISYHINTAFKNIWLIHTLTKTGDVKISTYENISTAIPLRNAITTTENDRGGINMNYAFVQHNRVYEGSEFFNIPWSNKDLQISYETFRDKILPGSEEKWTVKISGNKGEKTAAEMLVSMYDASLDQFKPHTWNSLKSLWPTNTATINWTFNNFSSIQSDVKSNFIIDYVQTVPKSYDALLNNGWNEGYYDQVYMRSQAQEVGAPAPNEGDVAVDKKISTAGKVDKAEDTTEVAAKPKPIQNEGIQIRKNFNETAFFFPALTTDEKGNISFNFTIPEALTQWKLMTLAHDRELASGYSEKTVITQKPLMVQPNAPRFIREGDRMELVTKVVNLSDKEITGTAQLELIDAVTNKSIDGWFKNVFPNQYFTVEAGKSVAVKFPMEIPFNFNSALTYRIKAISNSSPAGGGREGAFSDGEESAIPVLTNRLLVTETFPINMRNTNSKQFKFEKLLNSGSGSTLVNHALTVEYTSNPAWYAVQALPYLMDFPYECAEQNFNRYYANVLAGFVANSTPKIKAVFSKWLADSANSSPAGGGREGALLSNLQKNEELKSALLQETPWVLEAKNEQEQKKNIAILFDMVRLGREKANSLNKLKEMQSSNGGFTWFKGGPDDRYITQYIITGIGHLIKLKALNNEDIAAIKPIVDKALPYLDARLKDEYDNLIKYKVKLLNNNLSYTAIQYLYMRSFFPGNKIAAASKTAVDYYSGQSVKYWLSQGKYMQAIIALSLHRTKDTKTPKAIIASLKQNAIYNEEMGMYWKEFNTGGYYWHQAPIESQAMMIEAFSDIDGNINTVDDLKTWLLKQKQTQNWRTTKATAEACYALLLSPTTPQRGDLQPFILMEEKMVEIKLGSSLILNSSNGAEAGTGYFKKRIEGDKVKPEMGNITVTTQSSNADNSSPAGGGREGASWGSVYWQYFEDLDKITSAATPLSLVKKLYVEKNSDRGPVLKELKDGDELKVGDKVKVRIELKVDRNMEYVHMKDMRAAAMEPTNVLSQYKWQGGLGYYESTKDASTNFFFAQLPRGSYVFEYPMFVTHTGNFSNGITSIQCMYAPEFSSHSNGIRINVE
jgi:Bacterial Alpha-2-macroglobulin MG10 domain/Alpha-2-macroglobulin family/MG2 domain